MEKLKTAEFEEITFGKKYAAIISSPKIKGSKDLESINRYNNKTLPKVTQHENIDYKNDRSEIRTVLSEEVHGEEVKDVHKSKEDVQAIKKFRVGLSHERNLLQRVNQDFIKGISKTVQSKFDDVLKYKLKSGRTDELILHQDEEYIYAADVLYQCERGFGLGGFKRFGKDILMIADPAPWTDITMTMAATSVMYFEIKIGWEWVTDRWAVDFNGNVDFNGWSYAKAFRSKHWTSNPTFSSAFVRRRRWIRIRRRRLKSYGNSLGSYV